mgnify:CR=1 FL=1
MRKRLLAILLLISLISLSGCKEKVEEDIPVLKAPVQGKMETAIVSRGDIFELTTYDAKVYPALEVIYPATDGTLKEVKVNLGQEVNEGDVLAYLDSTQLANKIEQLEDSIADAITSNNFSNQLQQLDIEIMELNIAQKINNNAPQLEIAQMQSELEKLLVSREQTIKKQEYDLKKLQYSLDEAKAQLEDTIIKAPITGKVVYINSYGGRVSKDNPVIIITDESSLHIQSDYMEKNTFINANQGYALIKGKQYDIEYIPLESDQLVKMKDNGITIESRFAIKGEMDDITSGDYACICLKNKVKENVLTIPKNALYSDADGKFVYRMTDGAFVRCNIETGIETDIQVEIISGLEEGDVVYVQGS